MPMNPKQRSFAREYRIDGNGRQAAIRAGYSANTAALAAQRLLKRADVQAELKRLDRLRAGRMRLSNQRLVKELVRIAFSDIRNYSEWGPDGVTLRPYAQLSDDDAAAIAEVTQYASGKGAKLRLHDKRGALEVLARHLVRASAGRGAGPPISRAKAIADARAA
ncbi:MAG TPA: terminase small subunit [Stellaceae bacterium]